MTLEEKIELQIIEIIQKTTPISDKELSKIIDTSGISSETRFRTIEKFRSKRYIGWVFAAGYESAQAPQENAQEYFNKRSQTAKVVMTDPGIAYMNHLRSEKDKDDLDIKLKTISVESLSLNKKIGWYAFWIAFITAVVPIAIYITQIIRNDTQRVQTEMPQLKELQKSLKDIKEGQDSLVRILNRKSPTYGQAKK